MVEPIQYTPDYTPSSPQLNFEPDVNTPTTVPEGVASDRAAKAVMGIKDDIPDASYTDIRDNIIAGYENSQRQIHASKIDAVNEQRRSEALVKLSNMKGGAITEDDVRQLDRQMIINGIYSGQIDPRSVYEEKYSKAYLKFLNWPEIPEEGTHWLTQAKAEIPDQVRRSEDEASDYINRYEYITHRLQDIQTKKGDRGISETVGSFAAGAVPFLTSYMLRGNIPYKGFDFTTSGALEDQRMQLLQLQGKQFMDRFDSVMDNLEKYNLDYAEQFASAMLGQSFNERVAHNFGDVIDVTTIPAVGVGKAVIRKAVLYNNVRNAYRTMAESATTPRTPGVWSTPRITEVSAANAAGNMERAAVSQEAANAVGRLAGEEDPQRQSIDAMATVFTGHRDNIAAGPGRYGQELVNRIQESYDWFNTNFLEAVQTIMRVERIPAVLASRRAVQRILDGIKDEYPNLRNSIINQSPIYWDQAKNEYFSDLIMARADGTLFNHENAAAVFGDFHRLRGYSIVPQGSGFVIRFPKPVKETTPWLRDALLTAQTEVPDSAAQAYTGWLGWARTPDETLSAQNTWNRKTAVYAQNVLKNLYKKNAENLIELKQGKFWTGSRFSRERRMQSEQFQRMIDDLRTQHDPQGRPGRWLNNPADIDNYYRTNFNRPPSELEVAAYFDFKRSIMMDWALRNIELHKHMSRVGTEEWMVSALRTATQRGYSNWLHAVKQIELPPADAIVMQMGREIGQERLFRGAMPARFRNELRQKLQSGEWQMIRLWEPGHQPFESWSPRIRPNDRIEYVISDKFHNRPLSFNVLPQREGGHVEYDYNHYIKQARIIPQSVGMRGGTRAFQHWYEGDTTVMPVQLRALGVDAARILDTARTHLAGGNEAQARLALSALPIDYREFRSWFRSSRNPAGQRVPPRLSLTEPFYIVPKDRTIADITDLESRFRNPATGQSTLRNGMKEGSLARQNTIPFTQERDAYELYGLHDDGSRYRPLYRYEPAHMVDPLTTMNRGLNRIINSTYMNDYKLMSVEHWIQQAYPHMNVDGGLNAIRNAPFYFFHHADNFWRRDERAVPQIRKLQIAAKEIKLLIGEPSWFDKEFQRWNESIIGSIYGARNPAWRGALNATHWGLNFIPKASNYVRATVFHTTMGLFNWVQALVQNMTYVNIFGLAGAKNALHGTLGATLHQMSRMAGKILPDVMDHLDRNVASKMGWRPGELKEAHDLLARSGFSHVGGEHVLANYNFEPSIFQSTAGQFLDAGQVFFKGGERHMRFGAWYTAYKEFRDVNPTGPVTNENLRGILARADTLAGNMSVASRSSLQRGALSWTTQFLGYQLRLAELMTGKRISRLDKARLVAANAVMFGVPAAAGVAAFPMSEAIRNYAIRNNYVVGDSWWQDVLMNGLPAYMGALITGGGDAQQGTQYNVGDRYGSPGLDLFREAWYGDKKMWDLFTGAAGSTMADAYSQTHGLFRVAWSLAHDGGEAFPYTDDDLKDAIRFIASANNAYRGAMALSYGMWQTKRGSPVEPVDTGGALIRTLTGLSSQEAADVIRKQHIYESDQEAQKFALKEFIKEYNYGFRDVADRNYSQADRHFARGKALLQAANYPRNLYGSAIEAAVSNADRDMIAREDWNYYLRNVPSGEEQDRMEAFERIQKLRQLRGQ